MQRLIADTDGPVWQPEFHNLPEGLIHQVTASALSDFLDSVAQQDT